MSEPAYFYNSSGNDREYDADSFSNWLKTLFTNGVVNGGLQVVANGDMTLTVKTGTGLIGGKVKIFTENTTLKLATASGTLNRIDNIVLRRDDERRDFFIEIVKGAEAANPTPPALVRSGNIYDLKLAEVTVNKGVVSVTQAKVNDTRADRNKCGWVIGNTGTIDVKQLLAQINASFNEWFNTIKGKLGQDLAGNLQLQIDEMNKKIKYGTTLPSEGKEGDVFILIEK